MIIWGSHLLHCHFRRQQKPRIYLPCFHSLVCTLSYNKADYDHLRFTSFALPFQKTAEAQDNISSLIGFSGLHSPLQYSRSRFSEAHIFCRIYLICFGFLVCTPSYNEVDYDHLRLTSFALPFQKTAEARQKELEQLLDEYAEITQIVKATSTENLSGGGSES